MQKLISDLSVALHKQTMYPGGHPLVDEAVGTLLVRLRQTLADRPSLAIGVAPSQLIVSGHPPRITSAVERDLASKLHRRNVGALKFQRGIDRDELAESLGALTREQAWAVGQAWPHVQLVPLAYDQLQLDEDPTPKPEPDLWLGLAQSVLDLEGREPSEVLADPALIALAIKAQQHDPGFDERVIDYVEEFTRTSRHRGSADAVAAERIIGAMIGVLDPETLRRLLGFDGDVNRRREFVTGLMAVVGVETVLALTHAAAQVSDESISPALVKLFAKLAENAGRGTTSSRAASDQALRQQVIGLVEGWTLPEGQLAGPTEYDGLFAGDHTSRAAERAHLCEPSRIVKMSLEIGEISAAAEAAADRMVLEGHVAELLELLDAASEEVASLAALRRRVVSPDTIREVLHHLPVNFDALSALTSALGVGAAPPLLDALAAEEDRTTRHRLLELISGLGAGVGAEVAARVEGGVWYVQRNMLALLNQLPETPAGFNAQPFARTPDSRVRFEAVKLLMRDPATRDRAVCEALSATDERILRLALNAAAERCPAPAVTLLVRMLTEPGLAAGLQPIAARALAQSTSPAAVECLVGLCMAPRRMFRRPGLVPRSPVLIAALGGLATRWSGSTRAAPVLQLAAKHADPEVRAATRTDAAETAGP